MALRFRLQTHRPPRGATVAVDDPVEPALTPPPRLPRRLMRLGPAIVAVLAAGILAPGYRYGVGIDGLSYLTIAEAYARGDWAQALNTYWSPVYSWLLAPLLAVGIDALLAATLLAVGFAGAVLVALGRLLRATGASERSTALTSLATVPLVVYAAHYGVFVDLLLCALLLVYCAELVDPRFGTDRAVAARAGVWMGLAYLTKLYALPVVAVHLPLALGIRWWMARGTAGRSMAVHGALAVTVAAGIAAPWVVAISVAEGGPTVGSAAGYNIDMIAPDSRGNPIRYGGLIEPSSQGGYSAWEDPSAMPAETGSWTSSRRASAVRLYENVTRNLEEGLTALWAQAGWIVALGVAGFAFLLVSPHPSTRTGLLVVLAAVAVYSSGYLVTWMEERYLWFVILTLAVPIALLLDRLTASGAGKLGALALAAVVLVGLLVPASGGLAVRWGTGRELAGIVAEVDRRGIVATGHEVASADNWQRSAILCFLLRCRYWGHPSDDQDPLAQLDAAGIDRFLLWDPTAEPPEGLRPLAQGGGLEGLRVYEGSGAP